jgi:hypothetical protein
MVYYRSRPDSYYLPGQKSFILGFIFPFPYPPFLLYAFYIETPGYSI